LCVGCAVAAEETCRRQAAKKQVLVEVLVGVSVRRGLVWQREGNGDVAAALLAARGSGGKGLALAPRVLRVTAAAAAAGDGLWLVVIKKSEA